MRNTFLDVNVLGQGFCAVHLADGRIADVTPLGPQRPGYPYCSPGFIDLQINGWAGVDFSSPDLTAEAAAGVVEKLWLTGVTSFCPTLVTNPLDILERNLRVLEEARRRYPGFAASAPCYHLEGPYLSPGGSRGAHNPDFMRPPSWEEFSRLQSAAGGHIGLLTIAPELPGACDFIRRVAESGVLVAVGHTDGTARDIAGAARAGARLCTHLGNGCPEFMHRHHSPIWAQLVNDGLHASMICDGFHLPAEVVQAIARLKGEDRCILITDAIHVTGLPAGDYYLGSVPVRLLAEGKVVTRTSPSSMAGSTLSMDRAIEQYQRLGGASPAAALRAATCNPARLLGEKWNLCGEIETGSPAHLALWHAEGGRPRIEAVYIHGARQSVDTVRE
jgi:N-acetylglucosamine-6-phosphate deacetylase